ncbi:hypothetical protein ACFHYQ_26230, partial [Sphaerimonospora cavernae]
MKAMGLLGRIDLPGETASVPKARRYLRVLLAGTGHPHCDDALLLTTELVANAVRHVRHEVAHLEWLHRLEVGRM